MPIRGNYLPRKLIAIMYILLEFAFYSLEIIWIHYTIAAKIYKKHCNLLKFVLSDKLSDEIHPMKYA